MKKTKAQTLPVIKHANVVIHFGSEREGHTFRLHPLTNLWIQEKFPDRERVASVFIGFDRRQDIGLTPPQFGFMSQPY
jgi:hypothetical protein